MDQTQCHCRFPVSFAVTQVQTRCPTRRKRAISFAGMAMGDLALEAHRLMSRSLAPGTTEAYQRAVLSFQEFRLQSNLDQVWPAPTQHAIAFIAALSLKGMAASSIGLHVSALALLHKSHNWDDPTQHLVIKRMLEGHRRNKGAPDTRRPITWDVLKQIVPTLHEVCSTAFEAVMFKAAFILAYFGFMRVGEFTVAGREGATDRVLAITDIKWATGPLLLVRIRFSKTDQHGRSVTLQIPAQLGGLCPVQAVMQFIGLRPAVSGPLFCHANGRPLTRYQFKAVLHRALGHAGLPPTQFGTHSFRIGAATTAALNGASANDIQKMGRWNSNIFCSYIRL